MLKLKLLGAIAFTALLSTMSVAHAGLVDQYTTASAEFAQVSANGTSIGVTVEGAGTNQIVKVFVYNYTYGVGGNYWSGTIPNDTVVVNGIASISVNIPNTCDYPARSTFGSDACFAVNATFTKNDYLWKTNGVTRYGYGDLMWEIIGGIVTYSATSTGTVTSMGGTVNSDLGSTRAYMGKYTDVTVNVSTAN